MQQTDAADCFSFPSDHGRSIGSQVALSLPTGPSRDQRRGIRVIHSQCSGTCNLALVGRRSLIVEQEPLVSFARQKMICMAMAMFFRICM